LADPVLADRAWTDKGWIRGGGVDGLKAEVVGGQDAVMEDVGDVGLGNETAESGGVVLLGHGLDGGDAEVLVAPGETSAGGGDAGLGIAGNGGVAVEDEIAMGSYAGGVDLGAGDTGEEEYQDDGALIDGVSEQTRGGDANSWGTTSQVAAKGHGCTSVFALRCTSALKEFA